MLLSSGAMVTEDSVPPPRYAWGLGAQCSRIRCKGTASAAHGIRLAALGVPVSCSARLGRIVTVLAAGPFTVQDPEAPHRENQQEAGTGTKRQQDPDEEELPFRSSGVRANSRPLHVEHGHQQSEQRSEEQD